uniref:ALG11 alpha-1,2-mannosyltransferase n=1 Tax=Nomascus leucogenys TaxID=61853 RepID=A0A2I3GTD1_NOMLE
MAAGEGSWCLCKLLRSCGVYGSWHNHPCTQFRGPKA